MTPEEAAGVLKAFEDSKFEVVLDEVFGVLVGRRGCEGERDVG